MKWQQDLVRDIRNAKAKLNDREEMYPHAYNTGEKRIEFTEDNKNALLEHFLKVRDNCKAILEIGVCRNSDESSTYVLLNNKQDSTIYVGIDLDDKSFLKNAEQNVHTIRGSSFDIDKNIETFKQIGIEQFDFIFIDGWHSVNAVLTDWEYTRLLSPNGIVGFHDTSCHQGPHDFVRALDTEKWHVIPNLCPDDWGIGFAWQK